MHGPLNLVFSKQQYQTSGFRPANSPGFPRSVQVLGFLSRSPGQRIILPGIEAAHVSLTVFSPVSGKSHTCTIEHPQNGTNAQRFDVM